MGKFGWVLLFLFGVSIAKGQVMKVKFNIGNNVAVVKLTPSQATDEFLAQLPLTLTFKDFASVEKISYLPTKLSAKVAASSSVIDEGDFAYYAPWGNIAVFYKGTGKATSDLKILGTFESGKEFFNIKEPFKATIEVAK
jgi:Uncharacterized conserved protein